MHGRLSSCEWNFGSVTASGDMRLSVFGRERLSVMSCIETSVTLRATQVLSYRWQTASLGEPADGSSVHGETATSP